MKKLNQKSLDFIDDVIYRHKDEKGPIKLMLHEIQNELGYIPFEAMEKISEALEAVSYTHLDVYKRQHLDSSLLVPLLQFMLVFIGLFYLLKFIG